MKFVRIYMRDDSSLVLPLEKAARVLESENQIIKINNDDGSWSGQAINKADIMRTERDKSEERRYARKNTPALEEKPFTPRQDIKRFKPDFLKSNA